MEPVLARMPSSLHSDVLYQWEKILFSNPTVMTVIKKHPAPKMSIFNGPPPPQFPDSFASQPLGNEGTNIPYFWPQCEIATFSGKIAGCPSNFTFFEYIIVFKRQYIILEVVRLYTPVGIFKSPIDQHHPPHRHICVINDYTCGNNQTMCLS